MLLVTKPTAASRALRAQRRLKPPFGAPEGENDLRRALRRKHGPLAIAVKTAKMGERRSSQVHPWETRPHLAALLDL